MRTRSIQMGGNGEPTDYGLHLKARIDEEINKLDIPTSWAVEICWKKFRGHYRLSNGEYFPTESWVIEFYMNDDTYEQFFIRNVGEIEKLAFVKEKIINRLSSNGR